MGPIISIPKTQDNITDLYGKLVQLCEGMIEHEDCFVYLPLSGKVHEIENILKECQVTYFIAADLFSA